MIFLVDDDPIQNLITSQLISTSLNTLDYMVFNNGADTLSAIRDGQIPKLILLDINMPIMDAWEFLDEYSQFESKSPVIMLTSSINDDDKNKASQYPFVTGYYTKPVDVETIKKIFALEDI